MNNNEDAPKGGFGNKAKRYLAIGGASLVLITSIPFLGGLSVRNTTNDINEENTAIEDTVLLEAQEEIFSAEDVSLLMNDGLNRSGEPAEQEIEATRSTIDNAPKAVMSTEVAPAATTTTEATTAPTTTHNDFVTVEAGEGWWHIGERAGVDYRYLAAFNDKHWEDAVYVGDVYEVPTEAEMADITLPKPRASQTITANNNVSYNYGYYIGSVSQAGSWGYGAGWCTWYAYNARAVIGKPIPNNLGAARSWPSRARAQGLTVNRTPAPGAIVAWTGSNHVAFVEEVYSDGRILVSEAGWGFRAYGYNRRVISAARAAQGEYIH